MKKILLILVLLLCLAGGGGATWWFFLRGEAPDAPAAEQVASAPAFIELPSMAVPVIRRDGSIRTFLIQLALELPSAAAVEPVEQLLPRVQDRLLVTMSELLGRRFVEESGFDQALIKAHLERVARQVAGPDRIAGVLIRNMEDFRR